jgi:cysteine synthase A
MQGAIDKARSLAASMGADAFILSQFSNPDNAAVHYQTTGPEIWRQTGGAVDVLVAGVGTGGTLTGAARYLRERNPALRVVAVEPAESPVLSGGRPGPHRIQGIGAEFVPANYDAALVDEVLAVSSADAMAMARRLAREEGILCGISSGAAVAAAVRVGEREGMRGRRIVTFVASSGERYLSTALFSAELAAARAQLPQ